jgi:hypothetical protein
MRNDRILSFIIHKCYCETNSSEQSPSSDNSVGSVSEDIPLALLNPKFQYGTHKD